MCPVRCVECVAGSGRHALWHGDGLGELGCDLARFEYRVFVEADGSVQRYWRSMYFGMPLAV